MGVFAGKLVVEVRDCKEVVMDLAGNKGMDEKYVQTEDMGDRFRGLSYMILEQKYEREYHTIRQRENELTGEFMKRFLRLTGFVGKKAGPSKEQAKHFKTKSRANGKRGKVQTQAQSKSRKHK
nr:zinc finger, CCHC-type, retrotransposon Gag domain protein [Tanacetum cinerariifolium]